jgi:hypothetical protein
MSASPACAGRAPEITALAFAAAAGSRPSSDELVSVMLFLLLHLVDALRRAAHWY